MRQITLLKAFSASSSLLGAGSKERRNNTASFARRACLMGCVALVLSAFALTPIITPSRASGLTFTTIEFPGAPYTVANAINVRGQIVGYYLDATLKAHFYFLQNEGTFTIVDL